MTSERDRISDVYEGRFMGSGEFAKRLRERVHWMCRRARGRRVLDVGCSQGIVPILLGREGFEVVGVDVDATSIEDARAALEREPDRVQSRVQFIVADLLESSLDLGTFDTVILGELLEHLVNPERMLERCKELLSEDGRLVITIPFGHHPHPDHKHTFYVSSLVEMLGSCFRITEIDRIQLRICATADRLPQAASLVTEETWPLLKFSDDTLREAEAGYVSQVQWWRSRYEALESERPREAERQASEAAEERAGQARQLHEAVAVRHELEGLRAALERCLDEAQQDRIRYEADLAVTQEDLDAAEHEVQALTRQRDLLQTDLRAWQTLEHQLRLACKDRDRAILQCARRLAGTSYRLGFLIVRALKRPYRLLWLPFQVAVLLWPAVTRRFPGKGGRGKPREVPLPRRLVPIPQPLRRSSGGLSPGTEDGSPNGGAALTTSAVVGSGQTSLPDIPEVGIPPAPVRRLDLKVASILDDFSWLCLQYECNLLKVTPDRWREQLTSEQPSFLFVESAWRGNDGAWQYMVSNSSRTPKQPLIDLVAWCKSKGIPTVFWNKEDPTDLEHFLNAARLFDFVFTTDANCLPRYHEELGHDRVYALPFAAQPMIHNPGPIPGAWQHDVAFAGAWYADRHDRRQQDAWAILRPAFEYGLHIYDRNFGRPELADRHGWPAEFQPHIVGGVSYREMLAVYKLYKVFLNVNSVVDSPTMFSRRVLELLACGTPVISSYAKGIESLLGPDVVFMSRSEAETAEHLQALLGDQAYRFRVAQRGIRAVMRSHTYGHRLQEVLDRVGSAGAAGSPSSAEAPVRRPVQPREPLSVYIPPYTPGLALPPPPEIAFPDASPRRPDLVVGAIVDEIFEPCWSYECQLVEFTPQDWKQTLSRAKPRFVLIDSAWQGNRGSWRQQIARPGGQSASPELERLTDWCRKRGIPTVFWNREDPPNFDQFITSAALCDHVFTTDADCVPRYKETLGHDRVHALPFAAQPRVHNPISAPRGRLYDLAFAGTWYAKKHADRIAQMETILRPALRYGVHIYDRMLFHTRSDYYVFPEEYRPQIVGSLTYEEMTGAMKQYRVMLNVNSVTDSSTMCSCRVFEALMSGAAVVSGYALGIENLLGTELVPMPRTETEAEEAIVRLLQDEEARQRAVHLAQRRILSEHTYSARLDEILSVLGLEDAILSRRRPLVSVVCSTKRTEHLANILENFRRQTYEPKELIVVLHGVGETADGLRRQAEDMGIRGISILVMGEDHTLGDCLNAGIDASTGQYVAKMDDDDFYAPMYLVDLMHAFDYTDADVVGKHSYYVYLQDEDRLTIRLAGREHDYHRFVSGATMVIKRSVFDRVKFADKTVGEDSDFLTRCGDAGLRIYSADRFNYLCNRGGQSTHTWQVSGEEYAKRLTAVCDGLQMDQVVV